MPREHPREAWVRVVADAAGVAGLALGARPEIGERDVGHGYDPWRL